MKRPDKRERPEYRCPGCDSISLKAYQKGRVRIYTCEMCRVSSSLRDLREYLARKNKKKSACGSGVVAGKIVHGRGSYWGGSLA